MFLRQVSIEIRQTVKHRVNWMATLAAPFYMTLVNLPYIALTLVLAFALRSTFVSSVLGLG